MPQSGSLAEAAIPWPDKSGGEGALGPSPSDLVLMQARVAVGFRKRVEEVKIPFHYRMAIILVSVAMILLPLIYVALVSVIGYLLYYHLIQNVWLFFGPTSKWWAFLAYGGPALAGFILLLFMLKPLFSRPISPCADLFLDSARDGLLFQFVERVCKTVGAPVPQRICMTMEINAAARFSPGLSNMLKGKVELSLGLPLVAGLTAQQFAGVVAHELAHFRQGAGMRLSYVIRDINNWFRRVVRERDGWDEKLVAWSRQVDFLTGFALQFSRICVWFNRQILRGLMSLGHAISCFMLRQMELDADRYAVRLVGSETFESASGELRVLEAALGLARQGLGHSLREGRLVDDLPALVMANTRLFLPEVRNKIRNSQMEDTSGFWDSHPSDRDRILNARREGMHRVCYLEGPASQLFPDYGNLCRQLTVHYYRQELRDGFNPGALVSTVEHLKGQSQVQLGEAALAGYFFGLLRGRRPIVVMPAPAGDSRPPEALVDELIRMRGEVERSLPVAAELYRQYDKACLKMLDAMQARALIQAGFRIKAEAFQLRQADLDHAEATYRSSVSEQESLARKLEGYEGAIRARLACSLRLLPDLAGRMADAEDFAHEAGKLLPVLCTLGENFAGLIRLRNSFQEMDILVDNLEGNEEHPELGREIQGLATALHGELTNVLQSLAHAAYPFEHAREGISVAEYTVEKLPDPGEFDLVYEVCEEAVSRLHALYFRIMGRLALMGGMVEGTLGMHPIQVPDGVILPVGLD